MSSAKTIPIDDDVDRMYRESDSPSISDSMQRMNKAQYSYREQVNWVYFNRICFNIFVLKMTKIN